MSEPCRFYSMLLPTRQHAKLQALGREEDVSLAVLIRQGIDMLLSSRAEGVGDNSPAKEN